MIIIILTENNMITFVKMRKRVKFYEIKEYFSRYSEQEIRDISLILIKKGLLKLENGYCIAGE